MATTSPVNATIVVLQGPTASGKSTTVEAFLGTHTELRDTIYVQAVGSASPASGAWDWDLTELASLFTKPVKFQPSVPHRLASQLLELAPSTIAQMRTNPMVQIFMDALHASRGIITAYDATAWGNLQALVDAASPSINVQLHHIPMRHCSEPDEAASFSSVVARELEVLTVATE